MMLVMCGAAPIHPSMPLPLLLAASARGLAAVDSALYLAWPFVSQRGGKASVNHVTIVIFLEFFAWGLVATLLPQVRCHAIPAAYNHERLGLVTQQIACLVLPGRLQP